MTPFPALSSRILTASAVLALLMAAPLCAQETDLKDEAGKTIVHYIAEAPAGLAPAGTTDPAKQVGLFLCFHEHGRPTGDDLFPVRESLRRLGLSGQYVLIAANAQDPKGKMGPADHVPLMKLISWAEKTYPINPRRIYAYGKGEGGKISGELGVMHPDLITAGISYSWGWWTMPSELNAPLDPDKSAEFYMVLGLRDLSHHLVTVRDTYERVKFKGYHVIYREFEELGERTYHPTSNDDAIGWATRLRNKNVALSEGEKKLLLPFSAGKAPRPVDGYYTDIALVGGSPAGAVLQKLFSSNDAAVRLAAAKTCSHAIFDEGTTKSLSRLLDDPSIDVRRATVNALAMYANWRSPAAQEALIHVATNTSAKLEDRIDAADGLAQAVKLQAKGVRQDPAMFRALVSLLNEREQTEPLRAVAYLALAPVRDPAYQPGVAPEKKTPPGGWQQWLDEIEAKQAFDITEYKACGWGSGSNTPGSDPQQLFCQGGASLLGIDPATGQKAARNPAAAFQATLKAAEQGYVPAEELVGMMYATGKGVQQDYSVAGKWWVKAAEGGNLHGAINAAMLYRNGEGVTHSRDVADKWAKYVADHSEGSTK